MERINKKVPQNVKDALKEIGELSCIFWLYFQFGSKGWSVYRNFDEQGYDILLSNRQTRKEKRIEVKTRQRVMSSASNRNIKNAHFTPSAGEKETADFLVAYWLERNWFFIVPTRDLKLTTSKGKPLYKFIVQVTKSNAPDLHSAKYLSNWDQIIK